MLAQYLALCILALASSSRFGRYHLSSVDHDTFRHVPVPRYSSVYLFSFADTIIYSDILACFVQLETVTRDLISKINNLIGSGN